MRLIFLYIIVVINCVVSEVTFGRVGTLLSIHEEFPSHYRLRMNSIQENSLEPNTLFVSANTSIFSARLLPGGRHQLALIAGHVNESGYQEGEGTRARFRFIGGSVQTEEGLIVTDSSNRCLRLIQPPTLRSTEWRTSTYAGKCLFAGIKNGRLLNSRFHAPFGLVKENKSLFISDIFNRNLRKIDMVNGEVTTVHSSKDFDLFGFVLSKSGSQYYVGVNYGILQISEGKESWLVGWSKNGTQKHKATFSTAEFTSVEVITWLHDDILLVTDHQTRTLKVVNLAKQEVDVICPSETFYPADGDIKSCTLFYPLCLFARNNTILIGQLDGTIRTLEYQISDARETSTTSTSKVSIKSKFCKDPPPTSHAKYEPLESYPEGSTVYYQCTDNYVRRTGSNNKLVCAGVNEELLWIGTQIECHLSAQMVTASVLAAICICTVIAIVVTAVKIRSINKQLEEATGRQAQVAMTNIKFTTTVSEPGFSNQSYNSSEGRDSYSSYRDPTQHISTCLHPSAAAVPRTSKAPKPAPRHARKTEVYHNI